ncbi:hypothetical protein [Streptomyces hilarionis]|uniref:hypothetical protein n=1 Tax=Streptomyces hilarionis TaxID=2839954 RepID=UPI00211A8874|nr:hypothetical protein [Streptomyces hilarionis]MCQ9132842.1 hypothetical protein [Streptomyces hilarionis]
MLNDLDAQAARRRVTDAYADHEWAPHPHTEAEDLRLAKALAWADLERTGTPLDAPGQRIYLLGFVGPGPDLKLGMVTRTPSSREGYVKAYIRTHERRALAYGCFLVRAWISRPLRTGVGDWEKRALNAVGALEGADRYGEYFYDVDFDAALEMAQAARRRSLAG